MEKPIKLLSACCMLLVSAYTLAQDDNHHRHHNHASHAYGPVGVMGEHPHTKGDWMFTYAYKTMKMGGNRSGYNNTSTSQVLADFMVSPIDMTMQMHMFGLMYGVSEKFMFMGMLPYSLISMDHINRMGERFTTESEGIGDVKLSGAYIFHEHDSQRALLSIGISIPAGSINERDNTPVGENQKLPYPMQLGSGTYDFSPGLTYTYQMGFWSWGGQAKATVRMDKNENNYRLGNEYGLTAWGVRRINRYLNGSLRIDGKVWGDIKGADPELNPMMVPTSRTDLRGGKRVDLLFGVDFIASEKELKGNRLGVEVGFPVYQNLNGPQLAADYRLTVAWQLVF